MSRPLRYLAIVVPAFFAIGCSEKADGPPTGPEFHTVIDKFSDCDAQHISQLANSYFKPPRQQQVKIFVDSLGATTRGTPIAKNNGFNIMAQMEGAVNDGTAGAPSVGSNLVNHLLLCMYNPTTADSLSYPASFPDTFDVALTASLTGAFGHRASGVDPVYSRPFTAPFTAIAPATNWGAVLPPNSPARVVFYGRPATTSAGAPIPKTYDWRTIPHNATFSPNIIVAICLKADDFPTTMLNEQNVAILSFVDVGSSILDLSTCSTETALLDGSSPFQLARRLVRFGTGLLAPRPLMAAALSPGGLGGSSSKCCSKIGPQDVPSAQLTFVPDPPFANVQAGQYFPVQVRATTGGVGVNGDCITLTAVTNNGTKTALIGKHNCPTGTSGDPSSLTSTVNGTAGVAQFCVQDPKTGTITLVATGDIEGRKDTPVTVNSKKLNVKPSVNIEACTP